MIYDVLVYARTRMKALGFVEHTTDFNFENIPRTVLNKTFHLELQPSRGVSNNQNTQTTQTAFTVRVFRAPARDNRPLLDEAAKIADTVIAEFISAKNRTLSPGLRNIYFDTMMAENISRTNDKGVVVKLDFRALVFSNTG